MCRRHLQMGARREGGGGVKGRQQSGERFALGPGIKSSVRRQEITDRLAEQRKYQPRLAESPANPNQLQCLDHDATTTLSGTYGTGWAVHGQGVWPGDAAGVLEGPGAAPRGAGAASPPQGPTSETKASVPDGVTTYTQSSQLECTPSTWCRKLINERTQRR